MLTARGRVVATVLAMIPSVIVAERSFTMDLCSSFAHVCTDLTGQLDCRSQFDNVPPKKMVAMSSCQSHNYDTYVGQCVCSGLDASHDVLHALVDYSIDNAMADLLVYNPPTSTTSIDFGETFKKACGTFLKGSNCPAALQQNTPEEPATYLKDFRGTCSCGTIDATEIVKDAIVGHLASRYLTTTAVKGDDGSIDLCGTFRDTCSNFLANDIRCASAMPNPGCTIANDPSTLAGTCKCGAVDASSRILSEIVEFVVTDTIEVHKEYSLDTTQIDMCSTYVNVCNDFLSKTNTTVADRLSESNCFGSDGKNLATFKPACASGLLDVSNLVTEVIVENTLGTDISEIVCLGDECQGIGMTPGVFAIIIISAILAGVGLITFAYQRGDAWAHALVSNPLVNRIISPFAGLFRRRYNAKESPAVTNQQIHLGRGTLA